MVGSLVCFDYCGGEGFEGLKLGVQSMVVFFSVIFLVFVVARSNVRCGAAIPRNINSLVQWLHPLANSHVINALFLVEPLLKNSSLILKRVQKQDLYLYSFPSILALVGKPTTRPFS